MKKIYSFLVAAVAIFAAVSCNKELANNNLFGGEVITFRASLNGADTKAQLVEGKSQWEANDAITVLNGTSGFKFTTASEGASVSFTYDNSKGDFSGEEFIAVYPASSGYPYSADLGDKTVNAYIPTWQEAVVDSYHKDAALSVAYTDSDALYFMNAVALLKFTVQNENVKNVTFVANDNSAVSGNVKVTLNSDGSQITSVEGLPTSDLAYNVVYLVPNAWTSDDARFAAYFFGASGNEWQNMSDSDGDGVYEVAIPAGKNYSSVIFCRMKPDAKVNNWDNKWNQTVDLSLASGQIFTFKVWEDSAHENKSNGDWNFGQPKPRTCVELQAKSNESLQVGETYYMAVAPKVYEAGFSVQLQIGSADKTTVKTLETSYDITPNMILNLGELKYVEPLKERGLMFSSSSVTAYMGKEFTAPTLNGETDGVVYSSSKPEVAVVDAASGIVTLRGAGTAVITASAEETSTYLAGEASYTLSVEKQNRELEFSSLSATANMGKEFTPPTLSGQTDGVVYSSSNPEVAVVDAVSGVVTLRGTGITTITASAEETSTYLAGEVSYTLTVNKQERGLAFSKDKVLVIAGSDFTLPTLSGVTDGVTYESTKTSVATVDTEGNVTLLTYGTTTITATAEETDTYQYESVSYELEYSPATIKLYVESEKTGFDMKIYVWDIEGADLPSNWPGESLSWDSTVGKYYYDFPLDVKGKELSFLINVNGDECKSANQKIKFDEYEKTYNLGWKWLYLKPNSNWKQSNAKFAAYFFTKNVGEYWQWMMKLDTNHYGCRIPGDYKNVIFCRMNSSATNMNWDNKWNQTGDLTVPTNGNNLFTLATNAAWDGATTTWSKKTF